MSEKYANAFATQLASSMFAGDLTAQVAAAAPAALQGGQFRIAIDAELMLVTAGASTTAWTVTRGVEGTGAAGHTSGSVVTHILTAASLLGASGVFDVRAFGAKGDGSTDDTVAIQAAINAATVGGGVVFLPAGSYRVTSTLSVTKETVSLVGAGSHASVLLSETTGDTLLVYASPMSIEQAGRFVGFMIQGNTNTSAVGMHLREITGAHLDDVVIADFSGASAVGLWLENTTHWTERTLLTRVHLDYNKVGLKFSVSGTGADSFAFTRILDLRLNVGAAQIGLLAATNAHVYCPTITLTANVHDAGTVISVTGTAMVRQGVYQLTGEQTNGTGGVGISVGSGAMFSGMGSVQLVGLPNANANAASAFATLRVTQEAHTGVNDNSLDVGSIASFIGGGVAARPVPLLVDQTELVAAAVGIALGTGIASPFVTMHDAANNAFVVYRVATYQPLGNGVEVFRVGIDGKIYLNGVATVAPQQAGWTAPTGTATRTTFDTEGVSLIELARRLHALIDDLMAHGLIGA
jgi:hypothetical protein